MKFTGRLAPESVDSLLQRTRRIVDLLGPDPDPDPVHDASQN